MPPKAKREARSIARRLQQAAQSGDADPSLLNEAAAELKRLDLLLHTPSIEDFLASVPLEAAHQMETWGPAHDDAKVPVDWFNLVNWLASKALHAHYTGDRDKALHHTVSTSAVLSHWHARIGRDLNHTVTE